MMIYNIFILIIVVALGYNQSLCIAGDNYIFTSCKYGEAGTCRETNDLSIENIQATIDASTDGDGVYLPSGSVKWESGTTPTWTNNNIVFAGAGIGATNIDTSTKPGLSVKITKEEKSAFRITGITFTGSNASGYAIKINSMSANVSSYGWRIDNCSFVYSGAMVDQIQIYGPTWGLIDNVTFSISSTGAETIIIIADLTDEDYSANRKGRYSRLLDLDLGTNKAVYIEDSIFDCGNSTSGCSVVDSSSGGQRTVFRHNIVTNGYFYSHWTRDKEIDGHKYEIYKNIMDGGSYGSNSGYPIRLESGTGVIYHNTFKNYDVPKIVISERRGCGLETSGIFGDCNGTKEWDGNFGDTDAPGWPCLGQIGRGTGGGTLGNQPSVPLMIWGNGVADTCSTGGECVDISDISINSAGCTRTAANYLKSSPHTAMGEGNPGYGEVDYCLHDPSLSACGTYSTAFTPYTYPHPLRGASTSGKHSLGGGSLCGGAMR